MATVKELRATAKKTGNQKDLENYKSQKLREQIESVDPDLLKIPVETLTERIDDLVLGISEKRKMLKALCKVRCLLEQIEQAKKVMPPEAAKIFAASIAPTSKVGTPGN